MVLELAFLGRLVSIADGVANGFSTSYLLFQSGLQDVILLLVAYPWVVSAYEGSSKKGLLAGAIDRARRSAERNHRFVEPLGVVGLWAFVFFPFWSTGALVGGIVGYLLGIRTWLVFVSVLTGHLLSVVSILWFFDSLRGFLERLDQGLIRFLPWMVLAVLFGSSMLIRALRSKRG